MKQMKRLLALVLTFAMVLSLVSCGSAQTAPQGGSEGEAVSSAPSATESAPAAESATESAPAAESEGDVDPYLEPDESEAQRFIGIWEHDRVTIEISNGLEGGYRCLVGWGSSATERTVWEYQCDFDGEALYSFETGTKTNLVFDENGEIASQEVVFEDGASRFSIDENGKLIWEEFKEDAGEGMTFDHIETEAPTTEELVEDYFHMIGGYENDAEGASVSEALSACGAIRFSVAHALWAVDTSALRTNLLDAWESMTEEEQGHFDGNFIDVVALIDDCVADWDANKGAFEEGEVAEEMEAYLKDPEALAAWYQLRDHTLTMGNSDDSDDSDGRYTGVTAMDKESVEAFAASVRQAYLDQDWETISTLISYPINMYPDVKVKNAEEFLAYMKDKTVDESDREEMEDEDCKDLFFNGQGICLGTGQVWLEDPNYMTEEEPVLQIIAVSGIVEK